MFNVLNERNKLTKYLYNLTLSNDKAEQNRLAFKPTVQQYMKDTGSPRGCLVGRLIAHLPLVTIFAARGRHSYFNWLHRLHAVDETSEPGPRSQEAC